MTLSSWWAVKLRKKRTYIPVSSKVGGALSSWIHNVVVYSSRWNTARPILVSMDTCSFKSFNTNNDLVRRIIIFKCVVCQMSKIITIRECVASISGAASVNQRRLARISLQLSWWILHWGNGKIISLICFWQKIFISWELSCTHLPLIRPAVLDATPLSQGKYFKDVLDSNSHFLCTQNGKGIISKMAILITNFNVCCVLHEWLLQRNCIFQLKETNTSNVVISSP